MLLLSYVYYNLLQTITITGYNKLKKKSFIPRHAVSKYFRNILDILFENDGDQTNPFYPQPWFYSISNIINICFIETLAWILKLMLYAKAFHHTGFPFIFEKEKRTFVFVFRFNFVSQDVTICYLNFHRKIDASNRFRYFIPKGTFSRQYLVLHLAFHGNSCASF